MNLEQWRLKQVGPAGKRLTAKEAAIRLGVQKDVFYRWRTGERFPAPRVWDGIFKGAGIKANGKRRLVAMAQAHLWRNFDFNKRCASNPPGWTRLLEMLGGAK